MTCVVIVGVEDHDRNEYDNNNDEKYSIPTLYWGEQLRIRKQTSSDWMDVLRYYFGKKF